MTTKMTPDDDLAHYNLHPVIHDDPKRGSVIPDLPDSWISHALVNPYRDEPVRAVRTICVHSKQRMYHTSCGVDETAFRLFFDQSNLYLFPDDQTTPPIGPISMGHPVPGRDMFSAHGLLSQGAGYLYNQPVDFFLGYSPQANGYSHTDHPDDMKTCNWVWGRKAASDHLLPLRWFFTNANNPCAIPYLGLFALATFETFTAGTDPDQLDGAADRCLRADPPSAALGSALRQATTSAEIHAAICDTLPDRPEFWKGATGLPGQIITGLHAPETGTKEPEWQNRMKMTGFTYQTAWHDPSEKLGDPAMPLRVYYEWPDTGVEDAHMLTHLSLDQSAWDDADHMNIYLDADGNDTFILYRSGDPGFLGHGKNGIVKYDWAAQDHGTARATLKDNPLICPGENLNITTLPNGDRHFWVWYTPGNKGVLFMEIPQKADVLLVLTDYYTYDMAPPAFPDGWHKEPPQRPSADHGGRTSGHGALAPPGLHQAG
ncbi:hypothetical protein [Marivita sp.]|uniref:hypothetical protein n=1 Tax=Marivita sp. TaxID=2003365 RepID=UPI0025BD7A65|nr:hypothetical protein [Marivita sp.]